MMTKNDAIKVGKAICDVAKRVSEDNSSGTNADKLRHMGRGTCIYALDNIWYDVLPVKVREQFGHRKDAFYEACGWPD